MSFPPYESYMDSGVGWLGDVPSHWDVVRGRFCLRVNPASLRIRHLKPDDEVSFVPMEAVYDYGGLRLDKAIRVEDAANYTEFEDGDVIVAKITPCFENGKGALARGLTNGVAFGTTELHVLRATVRIDRRFLFYLTMSRAYRSAGESEMYGAGGQKRVPTEFSKDFRVPLPPITEQEAIVDFLDAKTSKIDTLVAKKRFLLEKLNERRATIISRVVSKGLDPNVSLRGSDIVWLGEIPRHWDVRRIKYLSRIESGHTPSRSVPEYWIDCSVPWISLNDSAYLRQHNYIAASSIYINDLGLANSSARLLPPGTVVFSRDATVGLCAITTVPMAVSQHFIAYIPGPELLPQYLLLSLKAMHQHLEMLAFGSTIPTIGMPDVHSLRCAVPPLSEQKAIACFLEDEMRKIDESASKIQTAVERLQEYRSALITAAVTGKIDVREL